ncbi:MAG: phosphate ABC transporter ATP-binding protein [bacterium]
MEKMITYQIKGLVKEYPGFTLKIDDLTLYRGEIFCLLGPSGAGKTTLLRILNFLEEPTAGEVYYGGVKYTKENFNPPLEIMREITTVFQRPALLKESVWNNIIYPLKIRGQKVDREEVMAIVEELSIAQLLHRPCTTLSGGEAQRVALARALVFKPRVILLDEPTANLDPNNIRIIEDMMTKYMEKKPTVVWITHNHFQAKRVGDRICLLEEGRVVEINDKENFFTNPNQKRTREFLAGEMFY